jgi:hypothetical protein
MIRRFFGWDSTDTVAKVHSFLENLESSALFVAIALEVSVDFAADPTIRTVVLAKHVSDIAWVILVIADLSSRVYGRRDKQLSEAENQRLKDAVAWRSLTRSDRLFIRDRLSQFKGQSFDFRPALSDPESMSFCGDLKNTLESAGWIGRSGGGHIAGPTFPGLLIAVHGDDLKLPAFLALIDTLNRLKVRGIAGQTSSTNVFLGPSPVTPGRITIGVGRKPRPEETCWPVTPPQA